MPFRSVYLLGFPALSSPWIVFPYGMAAEAGNQRPQALQLELYGFVAWVTSAIAVGLYMLWLVVPEQVLAQHGADFLQNKYWALALPAIGSCLLFLLTWLPSAFALLQTPEPYEPASFADASFVHPEKRLQEADGAIPLLTDIAPDVVSRALHRDMSKHH